MYTQTHTHTHTSKNAKLFVCFLSRNKHIKPWN